MKLSTCQPSTTFFKTRKIYQNISEKKRLKRISGLLQLKIHCLQAEHLSKFKIMSFCKELKKLAGLSSWKQNLSSISAKQINIWVRILRRLRGIYERKNNQREFSVFCPKTTLTSRIMQSWCSTNKISVSI